MNICTHLSTSYSKVGLLYYFRPIYIIPKHVMILFIIVDPYIHHRNTSCTHRDRTRQNNLRNTLPLRNLRNISRRHRTCLWVPCILHTEVAHSGLCIFPIHIPYSYTIFQLFLPNDHRLYYRIRNIQKSPCEYYNWRIFMRVDTN